MKKIGKGISNLRIFISLSLLIIFLISTTGSTLAGTIPTTTVVAVVKDTTVTIKTHDFPANQTFTVRIGKFGTLGINGVVVATTDSGTGGSFDVTYTIPDALKGSAMLSIRLQSSNGYYAYDWFYNNDGNVSSKDPGTYTGVPTTTILSVVKDSTVTLRTHNFPANKVFTVRMGIFGTLGTNGIVITTTDSGSGGSFDVTYNIPDALKGKAKIAIRLDSSPYYAIDWFNNNDGNVTPIITPNKGIPTTTILSVVKDTSVTLRTNNFPANQTFIVRMGKYGTLGINGVKVASTDSGTGGSIDVTYTIPDSLKGLDKIAIRLESSEGYYSYDWFTNK